MDIYDKCLFCCSAGLIPIGGPPPAKGHQHETETSGWLLAQTLPLCLRPVKVEPISWDHTSLVHNIVHACVTWLRCTWTEWCCWLNGTVQMFQIPNKIKFPSWITSPSLYMDKCASLLMFRTFVTPNTAHSVIQHSRKSPRNHNNVKNQEMTLLPPGEFHTK